MKNLKIFTNNIDEKAIEQIKDESYLNDLINNYWFITEEIKNKSLYYSLEGYLFPDTYQIDKTWSVKEIFKVMLNRMQKELDIYKDGKVYFQSLSSMLPPLVVNPKSNELILDMTAAPGGKTTQMAALSNNTAMITATEKNKKKKQKTKNNTKGIFNVCLNYGGQQEIVDATKRIAEEVKEVLVKQVKVREVKNDYVSKFEEFAEAKKEEVKVVNTDTNIMTIRTIKKHAISI